VSLCDFDEARYRVVIKKNAVSIMTVSMYLPCYDSIKRFAEPRMQKYFGDLMVDPSNNFDVSLEIDLQNIKVKKGMMFLIHMCTIHIRVYIYIYVYVCMCVCVLT